MSHERTGEGEGVLDRVELADRCVGACEKDVCNVKYKGKAEDSDFQLLACMVVISTIRN